MFSLRLLATLAIMGSAVASLRAHESGLSTATLDIGAKKIAIQLIFVPSDLIPLGATPDALATRVVAWAGGELRVVGVRRDPEGIEFTLEAPRTAGTFQSLLVPALALGHRQLLTIRDAQGATLRTRLLSAAAPSEAITAADLVEARPPPRWLAGGVVFGGALFLLVCFLGIRHWSGGHSRVLTGGLES